MEPRVQAPNSCAGDGMVFEKDVVGAEFKNGPHGPGGCSFWF